MKMKKFINQPENLTSELLEGLAMANKDLLELGEDNMIINKGLENADRVTIVTQGGAGHEPAISGFVGEGMVEKSFVVLCLQVIRLRLLLSVKMVRLLNFIRSYKSF